MNDHKSYLFLSHDFHFLFYFFAVKIASFPPSTSFISLAISATSRYCNSHFHADGDWNSFQSFVSIILAAILQFENTALIILSAFGC